MFFHSNFKITMVKRLKWWCLESWQLQHNSSTMQLGSFHFDESFTYILQREVQEKKNKTIYWRVRELVTLKRGGADNKRF